MHFTRTLMPWNCGAFDLMPNWQDLNRVFGSALTIKISLQCRDWTFYPGFVERKVNNAAVVTNDWCRDRGTVVW